MKLEQTQVKPAPDNSAWNRVAQQWERAGITTWNFSDLPERILICETSTVPVYAWPGLQTDGKNGVSLRLFRSADMAKQATLGGIQKLVELALSKEFAWLHRDLRALHGTTAGSPPQAAAANAAPTRWPARSPVTFSIASGCVLIPSSVAMSGAASGWLRRSIVSQNTRQAIRQKMAIRFASRSERRSLDSSALQPDLSILWNTSIFQRRAYHAG